MATLDQIVKIQSNRRRAVEDIANGTRTAYNAANPQDIIGTGISNTWLRVGTGVTDTDVIAHEGAGVTALVRKGEEIAGTLVPTVAELETLGLLDVTMMAGGILDYTPSAALSESVSYQAQSVDGTGQPVILGTPIFHGGDNARLIQTLTSAPRQWIYDGQSDAWIEIAAHGTLQFELAAEGTGVTELVREGDGIDQVVRVGNPADNSNVLRGTDLVFQSGTADAIIVPGDGNNGAPQGSFFVRNPAQIQLSDSHVFANTTLRDAGVVPGGTGLIVWHTGDVAFITDETGDGMDNPVNGTYIYTLAASKTGPTLPADWSRLNLPGSGVTSVVDVSGAVTEMDLANALGKSSQEFGNGVSISFGDSDADTTDTVTVPVLSVSGDATSGIIASAAGLSIDAVALTINGSQTIPNAPHITDAAGVTADTNAVIADGIEVATGSSGRFGTGADNVSIQAVDGDIGSITTTGLVTLNVGSAELTAVNFLTAPGTVIRQNGDPLNTAGTRTTYSLSVPSPAPGSTIITIPYSAFAAGFENPTAPGLGVSQLQSGTFDLYMGGMRLAEGQQPTGDTRRDFRRITSNFELTFASVSDAEEPGKADVPVRLDLVIYS